MIMNIVPNTVAFLKICSAEKISDLMNFRNIIIFFQKCPGVIEHTKSNYSDQH